MELLHGIEPWSAAYGTAVLPIELQQRQCRPSGRSFLFLGLIPPAPNFAKFHAGGGGGLLWIAPRDRGPPWAHTLSHGEAKKPGEAVAPSGRASGGGAPPGRVAVAHRAAKGGVWRGRGGKPRTYTGEKPGYRGRKRAGLPGNGAQWVRFGRHPGRGTGREPGKPGAGGAVSGASGGFSGRTAGSTGRKRRHFGAEGDEKGGKSPPQGGIRAENRAQHGVLRTACDGFTLTAHCTGTDPRAGAFRAHIGRNRPAVQIGQNVRKMIVRFIGLAFPGLQSDVCVTRRSRPGRGAHPHESTEKEKHP